MFEISRSIRQACPLSALLFILVAEVLAVSIRQTKKIKGIKFQNYELKIAQLADNYFVFTRFKVTISGLWLNLEKTELIPIGFSKKY